MAEVVAEAGQHNTQNILLVDELRMLLTQFWGEFERQVCNAQRVLKSRHFKQGQLQSDQIGQNFANLAKNIIRSFLNGFFVLI